MFYHHLNVVLNRQYNSKTFTEIIFIDNSTGIKWFLKLRKVNKNYTYHVNNLG